MLRPFSSAIEIAAAVNSGKVSAGEVVREALSRIEKLNPSLNAFTAVTAERALSRAEEFDKTRKENSEQRPLAGVPFAAKNLFDIEGLPTIAGSRINRDAAPAKCDATLIRRLEAAGAILLGALNMGEYAYDFTGENSHDGPSRNPHDPTCMTGGSSGGSGAAVAGGLVPLSLGSDTNGSIRVPASFCGIFGLKPTYGRLPRTGTFPFVSSLDHVGPLARSVADLAAAYDAMQGYDAADPVCANRPAQPARHLLDEGTKDLRIAVAGGYFRRGAFPEALAALDCVADFLKTSEIDIPEAERARSAAFVITASEAAELHLGRLRSRAHDFDPAVRDRLIAGAMIPAAFVMKAQKFRRWYRDHVLELFHKVDAIVAPATPCVAPPIGQTIFELDGKQIPLRPNIGIFTQPISFIGLPVVAAPIPLIPLPVAVQIVAAPGREDIALRVAHELERQAIARAPHPKL